MLRLTQILAPTDFSEHSDGALRHAAELARQFGAKLVLLHVVSNETLESISKAHVPPHPVDKVYEDLDQETREQYANHVPPEVRKVLRGRYPKHAWPEDPRTAAPPAVLRRRGS